MWICLTLTAAFFNAFWTAISKKSLIHMDPFNFTFIFRGITTVLLFPWFLYHFRPSPSPEFWICIAGAGLLEVSRITVLSIGIKDDYYSTYAFYNTAPVFTIVFAPRILPEKVNAVLVCGVIFMVMGAFIFYKMGRLSLSGLFCALTSCFTGILSKFVISRSSPYTFMFLAFFAGEILMGIYGFAFNRFYLKKVSFTQIINISKAASLSMLATVCYYVSIGLAPITRVNPLVRTNLLFGFVFSYFLLRETDEWRRKAAAGLCIVVGAICIGNS